MSRINNTTIARLFHSTDEAAGGATATAEAPARTPRKKVVRKAAADGAPKKKVKAAKKKVKGTKKAAKAPKAKKAPREAGITAKGQSVIDYLAKHGATVVARAINREKVWKACEVGTGVISTLKEAGLMDRADLEDGVKAYFLTAEGRKAVSK